MAPPEIPPRPVSHAVDTLRPWALGAAWACVLLLLIVYPLVPQFFDRYQFVPFLVGMVFLGLPHGAMDHWVVPFERCRPLTWRYFALFFTGYLALTLVYLGFWHALPLDALGLFLLLSWLHWGQGDAWALHIFLGRPQPATRLRAALVWAVRGALPIVLPPLAFPHVFQSFTQGMLAWYAPGQTAWALTPEVRAAGFAVLGALTVCYGWVSWEEYGCARRRAWTADMGEVALLAALFLRVPPILAVGFYFCVWHGARHIARLMLLDPVALPWLAAGQLGRSAWRTAGLALPLTVAALALLGGLYGLQSHRAQDAGSFVYFYLSLIAALTFPHFLLVIWMDWQERRSEESKA